MSSCQSSSPVYPSRDSQSKIGFRAEPGQDPLKTPDPEADHLFYDSQIRIKLIFYAAKLLIIFRFKFLSFHSNFSLSKKIR